MPSANGTAATQAAAGRPCPRCGATAVCWTWGNGEVACVNRAEGCVRKTRKHDVLYFVYDAAALAKAMRFEALVTEIQRTIELIRRTPGAVFEVRILNVKPKRGGRKYNTSGVYNDSAKAARDVAVYEAGHDVEGTYLTVNIPNPQIFPRSPNQLTEHQEITTSDNDIIRRQWLFIDCDPIRPRGVASTDEQLQAAASLAEDSKTILHEQYAFPAPVEGMSGNGCYLLYAIDLPNDEDSKKLLSSVLEALNHLAQQKRKGLTTPAVKVDGTAFNAARVMRLLGTTNCKGHDLPTQPHRQSRLVSVPDPIELVPVEKLQEVAKALPSQPKGKANKSSGTSGLNGKASANGALRSKFLMQEYLTDRGVSYRQRTTTDGWTVFDTECPFDTSHVGTDAAFMLSPDGAPAFKCFHDSCKGNGWQEVKEKIGAPDPQKHYDPPLPEKKARRQTDAEREAEAQADQQTLQTLTSLIKTDRDQAIEQALNAEALASLARLAESSPGDLEGFYRQLQKAGAKARDLTGLRQAVNREAKRLKKERTRAARSVRSAQPENPQRCQVEIVPEEHLVVAKITAALADGDPDIYQRGGVLVRVSYEPKQLRKSIRAAAGPRIEPVPEANLRTRITKVAEVGTMVMVEDSLEFKPCHPPKWLAPAVESAGRWPDVRQLVAVTETPVLLPDGKVLQQPGYDPDTGLLYAPNLEYPPVPEAPSLKDALEALGELLDLVSDFPFVATEHRSAWLAALFTPLARYAFDGPAPLFLFDANVPAAGKTLLADLVSLIATGRDAARATFTLDDVELRKQVTSLAVAGARLVLFDNLAIPLGGAALDAALTATTWQDRILGKTYMPTIPMYATWLATGNNATILGDTERRVCLVRLESPEEKPEERDEFRHPDLLGMVRRERPRLLTAALTVLAAYCHAQEKVKGLPSWGSFEGWSNLVRGTLVWCKMPDPFLTRRLIAGKSSSGDHAALKMLIAGWKELDPNEEGLTLSQALAKLEKAEPHQYETLRSALAELMDCPSGKLPTAKKLGNRLRRFIHRNSGGFCFDIRPGHGGVSTWTVRHVAQQPAAGNGWSGGSGWSGQSPPACEEENFTQGDDVIFS